MRPFSNGCIVFHNAETLALFKGNITNTGDRMFADPTSFGSHNGALLPVSVYSCLFMGCTKIQWAG
jgi:hypothetical protein